MKTIKILFVLIICVAISSCNKNDDTDDGEIIPREVDYFAFINGGTFTNYDSELGTYFASSTEGSLTLTVTDANTNVVRLFINGTGGLNSGTENIIGNEDSQGFITTVTVRDQTNEITYTSIEGAITILENVIDSEDSDISYVTGNFEIILNSETSSEPVMMNGIFENFRFVNQL